LENISWFNPGVENASGLKKTNKAINHIQNDLESLMLFTASEGDIVLLQNNYPEEYFNYLKKQRLLLPKVEIKDCFASTKRDLTFRNCSPWGWGPDSIEFAKKMRVSNLPENDLSHLIKMNSKVFARKISLVLFNEFNSEVCDEFYNGVVCSNGHEIENCINEFNSKGVTHLVIKAPYGTAGRGFKLIDKTSSLNQVMSWSNRIFKSQKVVIIEPWVERVKDFSYLFEYKNGVCEMIGLTEMIVTKQGGYKGCWIRNESSEKEYSNDLQKKIKELIEDEFKTHAGKLDKIPFSIDGYLFKDRNQKVILRPISEFNFRMSMGRIACELSKNAANDRMTMFRIINIGELESKSRIEIIKDFKLKLNEEKWLDGIVFLTPIFKHTQYCAIMVVSDQKKKVLEHFEKLCRRYNIKN